ncbi:efflux RND transporter periplasmic adaptor subunit [Actinoplanes couchii]|uniref:Macrolide-specific efflux protein MacA n=1 Tax=Actinoplanes couchii TaxID=403638 RepID=A0ABQ3XMK0_9ACTN|nr:efflux RND transporter periplasmic adaptor subunit [Actinoplanes couchii]MDR6321608.1 macrolide-specific efflux system membrane fusion protein [Actinoplanes couchii]GID59703.1 macrolide-specific efflux protein MacA [Actinoplanes couchii]
MKALRRPSTAVNALLALLIVGAGVWGWTLLRDTSETTGASASGIRTVTVSQGTVTRTVTADGAVASAATATATFTTAGTVTQISAKVGRAVAAGALLARVDPTDAQRDLALARANRDAAKASLDRAEIAATDTGTATNAVAEAEIAVDEAEAAVAGTRLLAPMAGTVVAINGSLGGSSTVSGQGTTGGFVDLVDLTKLQITAAFPESAATELKAGQTATVVWNALSGATTTGKVVAVDPTATTTNNVVTYGVTISLPTPPAGTKPGQTVSVSVVTGTVADAVMVNPAAITSTGNRRSVTTLTAAGTREVRPVTVGLAGDDASQITEGLTAGERVVIPETTVATTGNTGRGTGGFPGGGGQGGPPGGGTGGR